jgi:hypothetical protein
MTKIKKNTTEKLLNWDAHYAGIKATRERHANCITVDEVIFLALKHPSLASAPITIEAQIPVFTAWADVDLKGNMAYLKNHYSLRHLNS